MHGTHLRALPAGEHLTGDVAEAIETAGSNRKLNAPVRDRAEITSMNSIELR